MAVLVVCCKLHPRHGRAGWLGWVFGTAWLGGTFWWLFVSTCTYGGWRRLHWLLRQVLAAAALALLVAADRHALFSVCALVQTTWAAIARNALLWAALWT